MKSKSSSTISFACHNIFDALIGCFSYSKLTYGKEATSFLIIIVSTSFNGHSGLGAYS
jgi:hypothetical protein